MDVGSPVIYHHYPPISGKENVTKLERIGMRENCRCTDYSICCSMSHLSHVFKVRIMTKLWRTILNPLAIMRQSLHFLTCGCKQLSRSLATNCGGSGTPSTKCARTSRWCFSFRLWRYSRLERSTWWRGSLPWALATDFGGDKGESLVVSDAGICPCCRKARRSEAGASGTSCTMVEKTWVRDGQIRRKIM